MNRHLRTCFIVLVCTTVAEIVMLTTLVINWRRKRVSQLEQVAIRTPKEQHLCIPYDKYVTAEGSKTCPGGLKKKIREETNVSLCCGQSNDVFGNIIPKATQKSYDSDTNPELLKFNLTLFNCETGKDVKIPTAKLQGFDRNKIHGEKIFWNPTKPSYTTTGIKYFSNNGTVFFDQPGFYFIQSQIVIKLGNTNATRLDINKTLKLFVHLLSNTGQRKTLLENENHKHQIASSQSKYTSSMGAVFKLASGDQLYVRTSHPNSLVPDDINNYLSIHGV